MNSKLLSFYIRFFFSFVLFKFDLRTTKTCFVTWLTCDRHTMIAKSNSVPGNSDAHLNV